MLRPSARGRERVGSSSPANHLAAFPSGTRPFSGFYVASSRSSSRSSSGHRDQYATSAPTSPGDPLGLGHRDRFRARPPVGRTFRTSCRACRSTPTRSSPGRSSRSSTRTRSSAGSAPPVRHPRRPLPPSPRAVRDRANRIAGYVGCAAVAAWSSSAGRPAPRQSHCSGDHRAATGALVGASSPTVRREAGRSGTAVAIDLAVSPCSSPSSRT